MLPDLPPLPPPLYAPAPAPAIIVREQRLIPSAFLQAQAIIPADRAAGPEQATPSQAEERSHSNSDPSGVGVPEELAEPIAPSVPVPAFPKPNGAPATSPPATAPAQPTGPTPSDLNPVLSLQSLGVLSLDADEQVFDQGRQIATATGTALLRFQDGYLIADQLEINLQSKVVLATGKVVLVRRQQTFRAARFLYNLVQQTGQLTDVYGNLLLEDAPPPGSQAPPPSAPPEGVSNLQALQQLQPASRVRKVGQLQVRTVVGTNFGSSNTANVAAPYRSAPSIPTGSGITGQIRHWRFEARNIDLLPGGWDGYDVRLTNDPFTPPQSELVARKVHFRELDEDRSEVTTQNSRLLLDRRISIPTITNRSVITRRKRQSPITPGYDGVDRGGLFLQKSFEVIDRPNLKLTLTPQLLVQRIFGGTNNQEGDNTTSLEATGTTEEPPRTLLDYFGLVGELGYALTPTTRFDASISLATLNPSNFTNQTRTNLLLRQVLPWQHLLSFNYAYRERLFNGSLGVQTVNQAVGALIASPRFSFSWGRLGGSFEYQASIQNLSAFTDQPPFLKPGESLVITNATRYQASFNLNTYLPIWYGQPLPATPEEGLKNTPEPVQPVIQLVGGLSGQLSNYSNGYNQNALTFRAGIEGTFGHFSKPWFDYTKFSAAYAQTALDGQSPFIFDRIYDTKTVTLGLFQHIVGPLRIGVETTLSLDTIVGSTSGTRAISTNYQVELSRRAYALRLTYNPQEQLGGVFIQLNDFSWSGDGERFQVNWPKLKE